MKYSKREEKKNTVTRAGGIVAYCRISEILLIPKLLRPIDLVKPKLTHFSMSSHVPFMSKGRMSPLL